MNNFPKFIVTKDHLLYIKLSLEDSIEALYYSYETNDKRTYKELSSNFLFTTNDPVDLPNPFYDNGITKKPLKITEDYNEEQQEEE